MESYDEFLEETVEGFSGQTALPGSTQYLMSEARMQALFQRVAALESERDELRGEVERLTAALKDVAWNVSDWNFLERKSQDILREMTHCMDNAPHR